jgi:hypothetical protein
LPFGFRVPYLEIGSSTAIVEHEAKISKIMKLRMAKADKETYKPDNLKTKGSFFSE